MAKQTINLGSAPTGAGGDTQRGAFARTQANFDELYAALGGDSLPPALPVARGGTGAQTAAAARTALGLGTAATANAGDQPGQLMVVGAGGWLCPSINDARDLKLKRKTALYGSYNGQNAPVAAAQVLSSEWGPDLRWQSQFALGISVNRAFFRSIMPEGEGITPWAEFYHTGNTTRGSGGVLSAASPILRITDIEHSTRVDLQEHTFEPAGRWGAANDEARGVTVERLDTGVYRVRGSLGLALEGWRIQDPCSPDGGRTLGLTESEQDEDGTLRVRLFRQRWTLDDQGEMHLGKGEAIDVPPDSWIDVRLAMPAKVELEVLPPPAVSEHKQAFPSRQDALDVLAHLRSLADQSITPLQDALDLGVASDAELDALRAWKTYRLGLTRLPEQPGFPNELDWPMPPA
ncbi:tail fiber assembly protein [Pseudomonas entomophila]|uniref:phage tail fiber protein n=1 Tax=Pseudomonas entomophila TaxID=312306 RepID=UPI002404DBC3|nr:tail fiber assembly protein [Pseudomonas entomophila]MDF9616162.1 tail fiber assembly protein [Pseudomonas entomophila]